LWGALRHAAAREHVKQPGQDVGVPGVEASKVPKQGLTSPPVPAARDEPPTHTANPEIEYNLPERPPSVSRRGSMKVPWSSGERGYEVAQ
jgi:hypothetical protein